MPEQSKGSLAWLEHLTRLWREGSPQSVSRGGNESEVTTQGCPDVGESQGAAASQGDERDSNFSLRPFYISL